MNTDIKSKVQRAVSNGALIRRRPRTVLCILVITLSFVWALHGDNAVIPGSIDQLCIYSDFFYNYPSEDFFYYLNDRLLFTDRPDGAVTGRGLRNELLKIIRWHKVIKMSMGRAKSSNTDIITLDVADENGYKKASVILNLLGLRIEKAAAGKFLIAPNALAKSGFTPYYRFAGLDPRAIEVQLNKTHHFHFKMRESEVPLPWDFRYLAEITGLKIGASSFFETMLKNERFSLFLGVLFRFSQKEVFYIDNLVKTPSLGAWKRIYRNKLFLMGMFFLADAIRVTPNGHWSLPGGTAAAPFWTELAGKDYKKAPLSFLEELATKDEGKLNYLFLFSRFLSPESQKLLFTGPNAKKMVEIYDALTLTANEKLKKDQFPALGNSNLYTLLYSLRTENSRFHFPQGVDSWLNTTYHSNLDFFLAGVSLSDTDLPLDTLQAAGETIVVLPGGKKVKGTVQSRNGSRLMVVATLEEETKKSAESVKNLEEKIEPEKTMVEETGDAESKETGDTIPEYETEGEGEEYPEHKTFSRRLFGEFWPKRRFSFKINMNYLQPADAVYKDVYGTGFLSHEVTIRCRFTGKISAWYRLGAMQADTIIPILEKESVSKQKFSSFGIGYHLDFLKKFSLTLDIGLVKVNFQEKAMRDELKGSASGFRFDGGITYHFFRWLFTDISAGYISTSSSLADRTVKPGGFTGGIGLGLRF